jgi:hypothetical protein
MTYNLNLFGKQKLIFMMDKVDLNDKNTKGLRPMNTPSLGRAQQQMSMSPECLINAPFYNKITYDITHYDVIFCL